jgi:plastocyanin
LKFHDPKYVGNKMKMKIIVLLLVLSAVLFSGCVGDEQPSPEENATHEENVTPEENLTSEENVTHEENVTPAETEPEEEMTPDENETAEEAETSSSEIRETPYTIRLVNYRASPSSLEIKEGETVAWVNLQETPKRAFTLVSEDSLFENTSLVYKRSFVYTFNETGDYSFKIVGQQKMNVNVSVVEP